MQQQLSKDSSSGLLPCEIIAGHRPVAHRSPLLRAEFLFSNLFSNTSSTKHGKHIIAWQLSDIWIAAATRFTDAARRLTRAKSYLPFLVRADDAIFETTVFSVLAGIDTQIPKGYCELAIAS